MNINRRIDNIIARRTGRETTTIVQQSTTHKTTDCATRTGDVLRYTGRVGSCCCNRHITYVKNTVINRHFEETCSGVTCQWLILLVVEENRKH